jgi:hypothetical protein
MISSREQVRNAALAPRLSPVQEASLHSFGLGLLRPVIDDEHAKALMDAGLVKHAVGGLTLTDAGVYRISAK